VLVGDVVEDACAGNTIKGNVTITGTTGGLAVADNRIGGARNDRRQQRRWSRWSRRPGGRGEPRRGYVWAYGNSPAVTDDGRANIVRGWILLG
jgi:hypothetical protein